MAWLKNTLKLLFGKSGKKSEDDVNYAIAYFLLPQLIFQDWEDFSTKLAREREQVGALLYFIASKHAGREPDPKVGQQFATQQHILNDGVTCYLFLLPPPRTKGVYPYLAALLHHTSTDKREYFVLGQSPFAGGTTLRQVTPGMNANLGSGPEPTPEAFLEALEQRDTREIEAAQTWNAGGGGAPDDGGES